MTQRPPVRWLFADQLGPHFLGPDGDPGDDGGRVLVIESRGAVRRRRYHRAKLHLVLSALRHRARELGERATYVSAPSYRAGLDAAGYGELSSRALLTVCDPTSHPARGLVRDLGVTVLPSRGFVTSESEFGAWVHGRRRLLLEDFYRAARRRTGILMDGDEPVGGRWNLDADNRQPPPRGAVTLGLREPVWPVEDDIDEQVRADLDRWTATGEIATVGRDGPRRFAVTRAEALAVLADFIDNRLAAFGPYEDAVLHGDWVMAHSLLSVPMNLGLLDPWEVVAAVVQAFHDGRAPLQSVEGFVRQVMGWRDYVWHLYWHLGEDYVTRSNALAAHEPLPRWFADLDADAVEARCLSSALADVRDRGWTHHIPRLMVLGNWALQRGYDPVATTQWFTEVFVDAFPWVMAANVAGMALYADGGTMATKPYAAGGAYLNRMTDLCRGCRYRPAQRVGEQGCPFTAGYWWFLDRNADRLRGNMRVAQPLRGLQRLADRDAVIAQETARGAAPP